MGAEAADVAPAPVPLREYLPAAATRPLPIRSPTVDVEPALQFTTGELHL